MRNVEQDVYLIAEPQIHWPAVEEWLGSLGVKDVEGLLRRQMTGTDGEQLVELAARRCYKSFEVGLNPNVTRVRTDSAEYHANILNSRHGSVLHHSNFTFVIENVSRVFTHEWVRHAVGVAHSQESMRYVRMDEFGFWIPPEIRENEAAKNIFEGVVKVLEAAQRQLLDVFSDEFANGGFSKKKQLTSAFRRIAPDGLATGIVTTLNARALRHIIELRSNPGAEVEVRWVVDMIARMVTMRFPYFFGDFERTYDELGIPVWTPKYSKV